MKKFLSFMISLSLILGCMFLVPVKINAAHENNLYLELNNENNGYYVVECTGNPSGELKIPSTYNGIPIVEIRRRAFYKCENLTKITIPENVTYIGEEAFSNCTSLTEIIIPENVAEIGSNAFSNCTSLTKITIPENVTYIGEEAFSNCTSLTKITIPEFVTDIGSSTFAGCTSLTEITIPEDVTYIGEEAFSNCTSLTEITIPESVTKINNYVFRGCENLEKITISEGVTKIGIGAFYGCESLTSIIIPESVTTIGRDSFSDCKNLTEVIIPEGVAWEWEWYNFSYTAHWSDFDYEYDKDKKGYIVTGCEPDLSGKIGIPPIFNNRPVVAIAPNAFFGCDFLTTIAIPEGITTIGDSAFELCDNLTTVLLPKSVMSIGDAAFSDCKKLNKVSYFGNLEDKSKITIDDYNLDLEDATWEYACVAGGDHKTTSSINKATTSKNGSIIEKCIICNTISNSNTIKKVNKFTISDTDDIYNEEVENPDVLVKDSEGNSLIENIDYTLSYSKEDINRCNVKIKLKGNYSGSKVLYFADLLKAPTSVSAKLTSNFDGATGDNEVKISWSKIADASGYYVYYKKSTDDDYTFLKRTTSTSIKTQLPGGVKYNIKVKAYYEYDDTRYESLSFKTCSITTLKKLITPKITSLTRNGTGLTLKWKSVSGAENYQVYRKVGTGSWKKRATTTKTSYKQTGVNYNTIYLFKVRAKNADGYSKFSTEKSIKTSSILKPVTFNAKKADNKTITLTWTRSYPATGYEIYYSNSKSGTFKKLTTITSASKISYTHKNLKSGKTYYYKIRTVYKDKKSSFSDIKNAKL